MKSTITLWTANQVSWITRIYLFSGIFHKISIFKVLGYTGAQEVNLYKCEPGILMN